MAKQPNSSAELDKTAASLADILIADNNKKYEVSNLYDLTSSFVKEPKDALPEYGKILPVNTLTNGRPATLFHLLGEQLSDHNARWDSLNPEKNPNSTLSADAFRNMNLAANLVPQLNIPLSLGRAYDGYVEMDLYKTLSSLADAMPIKATGIPGTALTKEAAPTVLDKLGAKLRELLVSEIADRTNEDRKWK